MIRFLLVCIILIAYLIITLPLLLVLLIIKKFAPQVTDAIVRFLVRIMFRLFIFITGSKVEIRGSQNLPKDEAVLFVGNHRSYFDILVTYAYLDRPLGYVAKDSMEKAPILRVWMRLIHCLFLNRTDLKEGMKTILAGAGQIKNGISVFIFPEGTRSKMGNEMLEFKGGSFKAATKAKCPIVPVALINSFVPFDRNTIRPVTVQVHFLKPLEYEDYKEMKTTEIAALVEKQIQETIDANVGE